MTAFFFGPNFEALIARFPLSEDAAIRAWRGYVVDAGAIATQLETKRASLTAAGNHTPSGVCHELNLLAGRIGKPHVDRLEDALATAERQRAMVIAGLAPRAPDPTDAAGAAVRGEIRSHLRSLAPSDRARILLDADDVTAAAIVEVPPYLSGVETDLRERFDERQLERALAADPKAALALALLDGATDVLRVVAIGLRTTIADVAGLGGKIADRATGNQAPTIE